VLVGVRLRRRVEELLRRREDIKERLEVVELVWSCFGWRWQRW
jgi:hypothetical protein